LSWVSITCLRRYATNTFLLSGIFIFQINIVIVVTGTFGWNNAIYMESTENLPLSCRFHCNSSTQRVKWTIVKICNKSFYDASLGPTKSLVNITFDGQDTIAMVSLLWQTVLHRDEYYSRSLAVSSHLSFQNLISDPSLVENYSIGKKYFFVFIRQAKKWVTRIRIDSSCQIHLYSMALQRDWTRHSLRFWKC
jgi:hypothetical protein